MSKAVKPVRDMYMSAGNCGQLRKGNDETMRTNAMTSQVSGSFEGWLRSLPDGRSLAALGTCLRAAMGGGGAGRPDIEIVAGYFRPGQRTEAELARLCDDAELRRAVASVGRALAASEPVRAGSMGERLGRRWLGLGVLVAASLAGLLVVPSLLHEGPLDAEHRAGSIPSGEVNIVAPAGVLAASARIEWHPVLGAEVYELEVTDARGRTIFSERTSGTALAIPTELLEPGTSYFFRVRAQIDVARWISSDFQEIVVPR